MKTKITKNSLIFKTLLYLMSFSIIILLGLWVFQVGFLKIFYEKYQIINIKKIGKSISDSSSDHSLAKQLENIAYEQDICIEIVTDNEYIGFNTMNRDCLLNSKSATILMAKNSLLKSTTNPSLIKIENPSNNSKSLLYGLRLNNKMYVLLNTKLEDVNSTTYLLRNQLIYITLIVVILSLLVSYFVSKMLNKPILKITEKAKNMASGSFELDEENYNIEEIDELKNVLNYARTEIKNTDELRRDLMANVSHDLKTPLTMIKAYAELIRDIDSKDEVKKANNLNVIINEADRLNILVNDILDLSKLQNGSNKLKLEIYDLSLEINGILSKYEIIKETEKYKFIVNMPAIAMVKADIKRINQVLYNLINNAINYTGTDMVVRINVIEQKKAYLIEIVDSGKGISNNEIELIWSKYYKNDKNHQRNVVGTGLGLSIVKSILDEHKFAYGVISKKNKGTKFYFYITKAKSK